MKAFQSVDIVLTPTAPSPAFKIGEKTADPVANVSRRHIHRDGQSDGLAGIVSACRLC